MSTRLQDAHIYVMRRTFLDLLASRRAKDLDSLREQVIPWLIKTAWQKGLSQRYSPSEPYMPPDRETS
jgi:translation initiation factor eIF-2B subunit gamma